MNKFKTILFALSLFNGAQVTAQNRRVTTVTSDGAVSNDSSLTEPQSAGSNMICKGLPIPDGYAISGEATSKNCPNNAWIVKSRGRAPTTIDRLNTKAGVEKPPDFFDVATCAGFRKTVAATYNFNPAVLNDAQRAVKSAELDRIWNAVRSPRIFQRCEWPIAAPSRIVTSTLSAITEALLRFCRR